MLERVQSEPALYGKCHEITSAIIWCYRNNTNLKKLISNIIFLCTCLKLCTDGAEAAGQSAVVEQVFMRLCELGGLWIGSFCVTGSQRSLGDVVMGVGLSEQSSLWRRGSMRRLMGGEKLCFRWKKAILVIQLVWCSGCCGKWLWGCVCVGRETEWNYRWRIWSDLSTEELWVQRVLKSFAYVDVTLMSVVNHGSCFHNRRRGIGRERWVQTPWWWVAFAALVLRCLCPTACTTEPTSAAPKEADAMLLESPALRVRQTHSCVKFVCALLRSMVM